MTPLTGVRGLTGERRELLAFLASHPRALLVDAARELGRSRQATHYRAKGLLLLGLVEQDATRRYFVTIAGHAALLDPETVPRGEASVRAAAARFATQLRAALYGSLQGAA